MILVMSLVANGALLACSLMLIVLARAGAITPPASSGQPHALGLAVGSPTPTLSPTPGSGSLQVAPTSVELRCGNGQQVQYVVLRNTGTEDVQWQVGFAGSDQPGISVNPNNGDLRAGTSIPLLLQIRKRASDQQGTVSFNAGSSDNGSSEAPASLSYTISGCSSG